MLSSTPTASSRRRRLLLLQLSLTTRVQRKAAPKRTRGVEAASSAPSSEDSDASERSLRQRTDAAPAASAAASSSAVAFSFLGRPAGRPSFMGLAVVERQLIMQCLDFVSVTRISGVCRQLRAESLQPPSGRFIPALSDRLAPMGIISMESHLWVSVVQRACRLLQIHVPMSLGAHVNSDFPEKAQAVAVTVLLGDAARFRKIHHLELECGSDEDANDPLAIALQFLSSPVLQSIRSVQFPASCVMNQENLARLRHAIWLLPALTAVNLTSSSSRGLLHGSANALARIRQCTWTLRSRDFTELQPLSTMSSLETLTLDMAYHSHGAPQVQVPALPSLTSLTLRSLKATHAQARALFSRVPALRELTIQGGFLTQLLLGAGDMGRVGLPALRRCVIECSGSRGLTTAELRRFLHRCPQIASLVLDVRRTQPEFALVQHVGSAASHRVRSMHRETSACSR